ncbi:zinc finger and SCAN domain-containing protein 2-like [Entelurus aequoreus]|uniref:zinc finger and SCAN domain-containing protein 2-like n=1 Tax=Entelurus aequoreus TaxID=161455 RepID=UPI002B1DD485|nr:zinc finger and SCAN domain-containing protein 2-like [Entelurus aequoreus]
MLKELVKERLMAAADEIFALFERTIASYEEELSRTREKERHRQQLEAARKTQIVLHVEDVQQLSGHREEQPANKPQEVNPTLKQKDPQPPDFKEEEEREVWISQSGEECLLGPQEADLTKLPLTGVSVKTEDHEDKPQVDNLLAPLSDSDDMTSQSTEDGDKDYTQEPLSSDTDCEGDVRTHTDNPHPECSDDKTGFTCSFCAKHFCSKRDYVRHTGTHTGEKPFSCSVCGKKFIQNTNLESHMRTHTGEKPFSCSVCGKRFNQKANMMTHMRTHTGEKPFSCAVCCNAFSQRATLTAHMRTHTGEKPFLCPICGNTFSQRASIKKHMTTVCGKRFSQSVTMTTHTGGKPCSC